MGRGRGSGRGWKGKDIGREGDGRGRILAGKGMGKGKGIGGEGDGRVRVLAGKGDGKG